MVVLMGIAFWSAHFNRPTGSISRQPGYAFGVWDRPQVDRVEPLMSVELDFTWTLDPQVHYSLYRVIRRDEFGHAQSMVLIDHRSDMLVTIERFDPDRHTWPPTEESLLEPFPLNSEIFDSALGEINENEPDGLPLFVRWMFAGTEQVFVKNVRYPSKTIQWARLRKSPLWPIRTHLGRCELDSVTLVIRVTEMAAPSTKPDYQGGSLGRIVGGIRSLGD